MNEQIPESSNDHRLARSGGWVGGAILIALGVLLLAQNMMGFYLHNWWALFILIPAAGAFGRALTQYRSAGGRLTGQARGSFLGGVILTMIAATFLFGLSWTILGPALLILVGASLLINSVQPE